MKELYNIVELNTSACVKKNKTLPQVYDQEKKIDCNRW